MAHKLQYQLNRLDGRYSHKDRFRYYLGFSSAVTQRSGPLHFNEVMTWCIQTWGWSAEINQSAKIQSWHQTMYNLRVTVPHLSGGMSDLPDYCNPFWSWSNLVGANLRIYLRGDAELAFFQLAHAVDQ